MKLALIRHGQTDWNIQRRYQGWQGVDLNAVGREQAAAVAPQIVTTGTAIGARWSWLASSTSPRAAQTARIIGDKIGLKLSVQNEDLIERGFGAAEGMLIEEVRKRWPNRDYPGGETIEEVLTRALRGLDAVAKTQQGSDGIIVTHGTVLRIIVRHLTGVDPGSLPNGALAVLDGEPGRWRVEVHPAPDPNNQFDLR
ncbi:MAG: histidine phosphatase family protein [Promicromonosporaceae bacterium]|nr:histidine phosphatase family protein [Promicromonosporaceae bacterium]